MRQNVGAVGLLALARIVAGTHCDSSSPCQASVDAVASCASACISSAAVTQAACATADYQCQCDKSDVIQNAAVNCVLGACGNDALNVLNEVSALCSCVTANPTTPCSTSTTLATLTTTQPPSSSCTTEVPPTTAPTTTAPPTTAPPTITAPPTTGPITTTAGCDGSSPCQASADAVSDCAKPCIESAAVTQASCAISDYQCQCSQNDLIQNAAINCVVGSCGFGDALGVLPQISSLCDCVTANPTSPCTGLPTTSEPATTSEECSTTTEPPTSEPSTSEPPTTTEPPTSTEECSTTSEPVTTEPPSTTTGPITTGPITTTAGCDSSSPCQASADAVSACAKPCIESAAVTQASCGLSDYQCQCSQNNVIQNAAINCVLSNCGQGALGVLPQVSSLCDCVTAHPTTACPPATTTGPATTTEPPTTTGNPTTSTESSSAPPETTSAPATTTTGPNTTCGLGTTTDCGPIASTAVPSCAQACFTSAAPKISCGVHDYACQCQPAAQQSLTQLLVPCVATACPAASLEAVIAGASSVCACATAPPSPGNCATSGPATTTGPGETGSQTIGPSGSQPTGGSTIVPPPTTTGPGTSGSSSNCQPVPIQTCDSVASSAVPSCAQACFTSAAPGVGCDVHDYGCQCKPDAQASLTQLLVPCVATACPAASLQAVITGASSVCACASASPTLVAPGTCATGHPSGPSGGSSGGGSGGSEGPTSTGGSGSPTTTGGGGGGGASPTCNSETPDCGSVASTAVPSCAQACFTSAAPVISCDVTDYACQCKPAAQASLTQLLVPCVATACPAASLQAVITGASSVCACASGSAGSGCGGGSSGGGSGSGSPTGGNGSQPTGQPTGGSGGSQPSGGSGGSQPSGSNGGGEPSGGSSGESTGGSGSEPTGGEGGSGGNGGGNGGGSQPTSPPAIPPSAGSRLEMSLIAGVFAVGWAIAVVL